MTQQQVRIGKIVGCHGIRGDVKVRPSSDEADWADSLKHVVLKHPKTGEPQPMKIQYTRHQGPLVLVHFQGLDDRNQVEPLIGSVLYADMADLPEPDEDEFWVDDLIGLTVVDLQTGRQRGVVKDLLSSAGQDFLEVQLEDSNQTVVIPFLNKFFPEISLENRTISVDLLSDFLSIATEPVTADRLEQ
jgi:16S rRNA processing protein RimM